MRFVVVGERAERGVDVVVVSRRLRPPKELEAVEDDVALGERARLVEADDVDPGQPLDRGQLLHQHPAASQRHRGDAEGQAREQDQALGHHAHDAGDHRDERVARALLSSAELAQQERDRPTGKSAYWM